MRKVMGGNMYRDPYYLNGRSFMVSACAWSVTLQLTYMFNNDVESGSTYYASQYGQRCAKYDAVSQALMGLVFGGCGE